MNPDQKVKDWTHDPEWSNLCALIGRTIFEHRSKHPGTITEEIISDLMILYKFHPRETRYSERRRNHSERIRRLTHQVFKIIDTSEESVLVEKIATLVLSNFFLIPLRNTSIPEGPG